MSKQLLFVLLSSSLFVGCLDAAPDEDPTTADQVAAPADPSQNIAGKPAQVADVDRVPPGAGHLKPISTPEVPDGHQPLVPGPSWAVSLASSNYFPWPTNSITLTATVTAHVGAYRVQIYKDGFTLLATCTSTPCVATDTEAHVDGHGYEAVLENSAGTDEAYSNILDVYWEGVDPVMSAASHTVKTTGSTTVTVTADEDVGPSPFYLQVCDATTNTRLAQCGSGTTCSATVTQSAATTHVYRGYWGPYMSTTVCPPSAPQETSEQNYVTWYPQVCIPWNGGQLCLLMETVSLSAPSYVDGTSATATATAPNGIASGDELQIYNQDTGALVGACTSSPCSATFSGYNGSTINLAAFIAPPSATLSTANVVASSNSTSTLLEIIQ